MGVLYIRSGGAWVPVTGSGPVTGQTYVIDPAEVGPRGTGDPASARFGNINQANKNVGFFANPAGATYLINAYNQPFTLYTLDSGGSGYLTTGTFAPTVSLLSGWKMGTHPTHGMTGIWHSTAEGSGQYVVLVGGTTTYLNGSSNLAMRVNNADKLILGTGQSTFRSALLVDHSPPSGSWSDAVITSWAPNGTSLISMWANGYAVNLRCSSVGGERLDVVNSGSTAFVAVLASAFTVSSTLERKREMRSLRPERERIVVHHDPRADEVPIPDIMALRPVAFRPKVAAARVVPTGDRQIDPRDPTTYENVEEDPDTILGHEGNRERLGLIAEEVQHVIPSAVTHDADGSVVGVDYAQITVALLDHIQQLTEKVATLQYRITELENRP